MPSPPGPGEVARLRRAYELNRLCHRAGRDEEFRARLRRDPGTELSTLPLAAAERHELLTGDVRALYGRGVHPLLLVRLAALGLFGLDMDTYSHRMAASGGDPGT